MSKIPGFDFDYDCISDGEAFQRNHEYGDNFIDAKMLKELGNIKKLIGQYAKVFRSNVIKRIEIEKVTIGDFVVLEKGDIIPADSVVVESKGLVVLSLKENKVIEEDLTNKEVYQGMKVLAGTAVIMVAKIGKTTYLGKKVTNLLENNKRIDFTRKLLKNSVKCLIVLGLIVIITFIASLIRFWGTSEFYKCFSYSGIMLIAILPVELVFIVLINIFEIYKRLKNNEIELKNPFSLVDLDNIRVVCVYDSLFNNKNVNDMQRLYRAGIRVIMLSKKDEEESKKLAEDSGLCSSKEIKVVTGTQLKAMKIDEIRRTVLEVIVFSEMDSEANYLVVKALKDMGVKLIVTCADIEDSLTIKIADMGILTEAKRENLESKMANAFIKTLDIKVILEMLRIARKFNDSLKKSVRFVLATRIPVLLITLIAIIFNNGTFLYPLYIIVIYWLLNTLAVYVLGTVSGDELLLNVEAKKNIFTFKDTVLLALKTFVFSGVLAGLYFGLSYISIDEVIISYSLICALMAGCLIIALAGKNRVKEKVIKNQEVGVKEKVIKNQEVKVKEPKAKKEKEVKVAKEKPAIPTPPPQPPEKPWVSDNDKNIEEKKNDTSKEDVSKTVSKNKKQQRAEELKGKML